MRNLILGICIGGLMFTPAQAGIDTRHPHHERAERFVCDHPYHAYRAHGLTIMPEACDR